MAFEKNFMMADWVMFEDYCNLRCNYCILSSIKDFKSKIPQEKIEFYNEYLRKTARYMQEHDIMIFKVSGGEVLLLPELMPILKEVNTFARVQLLTNATLVNDKHIQIMKEMPNFGVQVSLDGHTYQMNKDRFSSEAGFKKVLNNTRRMLDENIPVEINACITRDNIENIEDFFKYLMEYADKELMVYLLPIRGHAGEENMFTIQKEQFKYIESIINNYDKYRAILPPKEYFTYLLDYLDKGHKPKGWRCWVTYLIMGLLYEGDLKACPGIPTNNQTVRYNIFNNDGKPFEYNKLYDILNRKCSTISLCEWCFNHYEDLNLYLNGVIPIEEIQRIWLYKEPRVVKFLKEMRAYVESTVNT